MHQLDSFDRQVFAAKSMVDRSLVDFSIFDEIFQGNISSANQNSALSLLYSLAMVNQPGVHILPVSTGQFLLLQALGVASASRRLVPLWAAKILQVPYPCSCTGEVKAIVEAGLKSNVPKDVTMAQFVSNRYECKVHAPTRSSSKHAKLLPEINAKFGPVISEYAIAPGIVVDCAIPKNKQAIEILGPCHYLHDIHTGQLTPTGPTNFKLQSILGLGWEVSIINVANRHIPVVVSNSF